MSGSASANTTSVNPSQPPKAAQPLYFFNAPIDFLWIGGLSLIVCWLLYSVYGHSTKHPIAGESAYWIVIFTTYASYFVNWPHFAASSYRLYHTKQNIRQYPMTALVVPWVVIALMIGSFMYPLIVAPIFVKIYLIWSPYHFSGQTLGITMIYCRRAGVKISKLERLALSSFIYGTYIAMTVRSEYGNGINSFWGVKYPTFGLPEWGRNFFAPSGVLSEPILSLIPLAIMYTGGIAFLAFAIKRRLTGDRNFPAIILLPGITQYVWFVTTASWPLFNQMVPFFHSMQYMMIAWSMQMRESMAARKAIPGVSFIFAESGRWGFLILLGGAFLFSETFGLPKLGHLTFGVETGVATGIVLAGVQIHHFFVDGVIWKLKSQTVASPLMMNVDDLLHSKAEPIDVSVNVNTPLPVSAKAANQVAGKRKRRQGAQS